MPRFLGVLAYPILGLIAGISVSPATPQPAPPPATIAQGVFVPTIAPIVAEGDWNYPELDIGVTVPRVTPVRHYYSVAPRANLAAVYSAGASAVGVPYVRGGSSLSGFDCSGFVSWAYAQAGVTLPRTTSGIRWRATVISRADARPGDILYWPGHVAIYAGPGLRLDSNRPGSTVQVRAIYGNPTYLRVG